MILIIHFSWKKYSRNGISTERRLAQLLEIDINNIMIHQTLGPTMFMIAMFFAK